MPHLEFTGASVITGLKDPISDTATSCELLAGSGWPTGATGKNFIMTLGDRDAGQSEEKCLCSSRVNEGIVIAQRGYDGTAAQAWGANTRARHTIAGVWAAEVSDHIWDDTRDDHGQYHTASRHAAVLHTIDMMAAGSVGSSQIVDGSVGQVELAKPSVGTPELLAGSVVPSHLNSSVYGVAGSVASIDPGDTAAAGADTALARIDHQHPLNPAIPWGVVAYQRLTTTPAAFGPGSVNSDMVLASVAMNATRLYRVGVHVSWDLSAAMTYTLDLTEDGNVIGQFDITDGDRDICDSALVILPTGASHTYRLRLNEVVAGGTISLVGSAASPRAFWIEDIGPR